MPDWPCRKVWMVEADPDLTPRRRAAQIPPGNIMKTATTVITIIIAAFAGAAGAQAQGQPARTPPEQLGKVHFQTSCSPAVEKQFDRAMTLLHSFWAKDAIEGFTAVLQQDPGCAIAYWGIAMSVQQNPLTAQEPNSKATQDALTGLDQAKVIGAKTQRERDYLAAIDLIYRDAGKIEFRTRRLAYEKAMETLA